MRAPKLVAAPGLKRSPRVLLVGDVMLDRYYEGAAERISPEAPVPVLHVQRRFSRPGGAANVAVNVSAMGAKVTLVGVVGSDSAGSDLKDLLTADGVDCRGVMAERGVLTTIKTRLLCGHHQLARFDEEQRLTDVSIHEQLVESLQEQFVDFDAIVISDYDKGVCCPAVCRAVIEGAKTRTLPIIVDPKGLDFEKYAGATVLTPNRHEAAAVVGFQIRAPDDAFRAAEWLRTRFSIEAVIITLGEQGMVLVTSAETVAVPTQARLVYDVTGAGDSAVAALAVAIGRGNELREACFMANVAAGVQVGRIGTARVSWSDIIAAIACQEMSNQTKTVHVSKLLEIVREARTEGKRIGFTNGCFDILHHGHVALLESAARECDVLIVGVNSDASVSRLKGSSRPFVRSEERQAVLAGLSAVNWVCEFEEDTPLELIKAVEPDVLFKGADYRAQDIVGADIVLGRGGRVVTPLFIQNASSTSIIDRITLAARE